MAIRMSPRIPFKGGFSTAPEELRDITQNTKVHNFVPTLKGTVRRPPFVRSKDEIIANYDNEVLELKDILVQHKGKEYIALYVRDKTYASYISFLDPINLKEISRIKIRDNSSGESIISIADYILAIPYTGVVNSLSQEQIDFQAESVADKLNNAKKVNYIVVKAAVPDTMYKVTIGNKTYQGSWSTGTVVNENEVAATIKDHFGTTLGDWLIRKDNTLIFINNDGRDVTVSTDSGLPLLTTFSDRVSSEADLPQNGIPEYFHIKVGNSKDYYYVSWKDNTWVETSPLYTFSSETLLHGLSSSWKKIAFDDIKAPTVTDYTLKARLTGDEKIAPAPLFTKEEIRQAFLFKNRLCLLTESGLVCSEANDFNNFFPKEATQLLQSDPIDIKIGIDLLYAIPYNEGFVLFGRNQQFFVSSGGRAFSPISISVTPTTTYNIKPQIAPVSTGSSLLFITQDNKLFEYFSRYQTTQNTAAYISEDVEEKIDNVTQLCYDVKNSRAYMIQKDSVVALHNKSIGENMYRAFYTFKPEWDEAGSSTDLAPLRFIVTSQGLHYIRTEVNLTKIRGMTAQIDRDNLIYLDDSYVLDGNKTYDSDTNTTRILNNLITPNICIYNKTRDILYDSRLTYKDYKSNPFVKGFDPDYRPGNGFQLRGDVTQDELIAGYPYTSTVNIQKYIPRDQYNQPILYRQLQYVRYILDWEGVNLDITYGDKFNQFKHQDTGVYWDDTLINKRKNNVRRTEIYLRGYQDTQVEISTETVFPLVLSSHAFWINAAYKI